jgi:glucose/arabinose dehydrogenase
MYPRFSASLLAPILLAPILLAACAADGVSASPDDTPETGRRDASVSDERGPETSEPSEAHERFCDLPGSVKFTVDGVVAVPGGAGAEVLGFLHLPPGFCAHYFGRVGNTRQLRFAPGGELFVASPTTGTTGGNAGAGRSAIVVLPDDDADGAADATLTFLGDLPSTQGLMFTEGYLYYQDFTKILRLPYQPGNRLPAGPGELVVDVTSYVSLLHWPKTIDRSDDGTIYVSNGSDQGEECLPSHPFRGGILKIEGSGVTPVAKGFRNPIALRCQRGHNLCFAVELAEDYTAGLGGREKLVPVRDGDDWGYPCCYTKDFAARGVGPTPNCENVTPENVSFFIGHTPFGVDFAPATWPALYAGSAFVSLHGIVGTWEGARVVAVATDPVTGTTLAGSDLEHVSTGSMSDFATGWDDGQRQHGRPSAITFAPDGRLFLGNDNDGNIFWIAPLDLAR